jgi:hypothetical protein
MLPNLEPIDPESVQPPSDLPPPLVGPAELGGSTTTRPLTQPRFLPAPTDDTGPPPLDYQGTPRPRLDSPARPPGRSLSLEPEEDPGDNPRRSRPEPPPPPQRRRLFGFIPLPGALGQPAPAAIPPAPRRGTLDEDDDLAETNPDIALENRLDKQIRAALGDRISSLNVRADGRNVSIQARPSRFWHKRGVQRTLDTLPSLAGYRTRIKVD